VSTQDPRALVKRRRRRRIYAVKTMAASQESRNEVAGKESLTAQLAAWWPSMMALAYAVHNMGLRTWVQHNEEVWASLMG
jgi:hypothetical protein